jgi:mannan endo-1,4-beta-mannosidase
MKRPFNGLRACRGVQVCRVGLTLAILHCSEPELSAQILLEAENGTLVGTSLTTATPGYSGTGYVTGFDATGDAVSWTFPATVGVYDLQIRFRSPYGAKAFNATLNGVVTSGKFPGTNGFAIYDAGLVQLTNGSNTLKISGGWNYYEIDRVDLIAGAAPPPPIPVPATPCDTQATFAVRMLLSDLAADYGKMTWSGQQSLSEVTNVFQITGSHPAIVASDFIYYSPSCYPYNGSPSNPGLTEQMLAMDNSGYALSMIWHWYAPTNLLNTTNQPWYKGFYTSATTFDVAAALANTNSVEYALLLRDIDAIGVQLKKFANTNLPVLWRPLHEAEGGWFWWGAKGPEPFKQLWRLLYGRLTQYHGLHNLLWVLTSSDPAWYPGDDVVDIIGVDAYPSDTGDPLFSIWNTLKERFDGRKLIALTEFGGVPDVPKMHQFGVWFAYFLPWTGSLGPTGMPAEMVVRVYQSTNVVTLEEANASPSRIVSCGRTNLMIQLNAKGTRGATHRLLAATNVNLPAASWTPIATNKFSGGVSPFTDTKATNLPTRFYRVVRP